MECLSDFLMVNRNHWGITAITPRLRVFPEYRPGGDMNSGILPHTNMYLPGESGLRYYCSPRSIVWIDHPHHQDRSIGIQALPSDYRGRSENLHSPRSM